MKWLKTWGIGNGGMRCYESYLEVPDDYEEWYGEEGIAELIERDSGPFSGGVRSINWEEVDKLPLKEIERRIKRAGEVISYNEKLIMELSSMKVGVTND
jgi:hypothetical protein